MGGFATRALEHHEATVLSPAAVLAFQVEPGGAPGTGLVPSKQAWSVYMQRVYAAKLLLPSFVLPVTYIFTDRRNGQQPGQEVADAGWWSVKRSMERN